LFVFLGLGSLIYAASLTNYTIDHRKPNSLNYMVDEDSKTAYYTTYDSDIDEWTGKIFTRDAQKGPIDHWEMTSKYNTLIRYHHEAPYYSFDLPLIRIDSSQLQGDEMCFELFIQSRRQANRWVLFSNKPLKVSKWSINGKSYLAGMNDEHTLNGILLNHFIADPDEILQLEWTGHRGDLSAMSLLEIKHDLLDNPNFSVTHRPDHMMPAPFVVNDATMVRLKLISQKE